MNTSWQYKMLQRKQRTSLWDDMWFIREGFMQEEVLWAGIWHNLGTWGVKDIDIQCEILFQRSYHVCGRLGSEGREKSSHHYFWLQAAFSLPTLWANGFNISGHVQKKNTAHKRMLLFECVKYWYLFLSVYIQGLTSFIMKQEKNKANTSNWIHMIGQQNNQYPG